MTRRSILEYAKAVRERYLRAVKKDQDEDTGRICGGDGDTPEGGDTVTESGKEGLAEETGTPRIQSGSDGGA